MRFLGEFSVCDILLCPFSDLVDYSIKFLAKHRPTSRAPRRPLLCTKLIKQVGFGSYETKKNEKCRNKLAKRKISSCLHRFLACRPYLKAKRAQATWLVLFYLVKTPLLAHVIASLALLFFILRIHARPYKKISSSVNRPSRVSVMLFCPNR